MKTDHRPLFPRRRAKRESRFSFRFLSALWCFWLFVAPRGAAQTYRVALPNYHYAFPRDHFSHPAYQTEWWYYTGNLTALDGRRFGFELTFFRQGVSREPAASPWDLRDVYVAHLALSDLSNGHFYYLERVNRAGPGLAGAEESASRIWNGNWQILWKGSEQQLQAIAENFELHFTLHSEKPPVIHGENGVSQKAAGPGQASHYYSLTRLDAQGTILLGGRSFPVSGLAWMDHEFFTHQMTAEQTGWDWFSLQLDNRSELMLFRIRRKDGSIDPFSAGTYVDAQGRATPLYRDDFDLEPLAENWHSPVSGATYPIRWRIGIPKLGMRLEATTLLPQQELAPSRADALANSSARPSSARSAIIPTYWEGAISVSGSRESSVTAPATPLHGVGYLEMTGYSASVSSVM